VVAAQDKASKRGVMHGIASWYGGVFNGRKTASGEKFDMHELTACHPTLPFGSLVRVINRRNKRSVVVRINDRGDLVNEDRVIDLSWAAAERLAMTRAGLAKVDLEVLSLGDAHSGN
jgi:rare lipoprotein A